MRCIQISVVRANLSARHTHFSRMHLHPVQFTAACCFQQIQVCLCRRLPTVWTDNTQRFTHFQTVETLYLDCLEVDWKIYLTRVSCDSPWCDVPALDLDEAQICKLTNTYDPDNPLSRSLHTRLQQLIIIRLPKNHSTRFLSSTVVYTFVKWIVVTLHDIARHQCCCIIVALQ